MTNQKLIEVLKAEIAGKVIERSHLRYDTAWEPRGPSAWDLTCYEYRIAPEPKKAEGRWERVEIELTGDKQYMIRCDDQKNVLVSLPNAPRYHGFGGIDYQNPFYPKSTMRSMVPIMFNRRGDYSVWSFDDDYRPGIPVAAWFWREEE